MKDKRMYRAVLTCETVAATIVGVGETPGDTLGEPRTRDLFDGGTSLAGSISGTVSPSRALYTKYIACFKNKFSYRWCHGSVSVWSLRYLGRLYEGRVALSTG